MAETIAPETRPTRAERLAAVRARMAAAGLGALVVRATDRYLNEYTPARESLRIWLTGFTGSVGDALVTAERVFLFVDGRYHLQAERECDPERIEVVKLGLGTGIDEAVEKKLVELASKHGAGLRIGFEPEKTPIDLEERWRKALAREGAALLAQVPNLVAAARGDLPPPEPVPLEPVPQRWTGETVGSKLARLREALSREGAGAALLTRLDEIAWVTNLRAYELDYSATFRALLWVGPDEAALFVDPRKAGDEVRAALGPGFALAGEDGWERWLAARLEGTKRLRVLLDPKGSTVAHESALRAALGERGEIVRATSPVLAMKARKNPDELAAMKDSFARADLVVAEATLWLNRLVAAGKPVSEADLAAEVERRFRAHGARALSFRVIAAAGANGAVIHYSNPDPKRLIRKGELVLLDTGAYFEPGYATDLTRTFLAGAQAARPDRKQKLVYTLVLKASIRGLMARFPAGTTGVQLDALVRAPIWAAGFDYLHGTGHGVGILVHEGPPRVATRSDTPLEPGQVFSIEPGIYLPGWGGVRIENLATVEPDPKAEGFLRVRPLTFSPLDRRLIDPAMLSADEKEWLRRWQRRRV